ncbi:o-succinylbenzoate synthase [Brevibacterium album]|uniref:o-succinylbenzoate synthase n=1 Tax=Brevibacterium album TaxID=417948 RepID=UPI00048FAAC8|nr:o-succinylbenzoate synthase [Brevibacterium album]
MLIPAEVRAVLASAAGPSDVFDRVVPVSLPMRTRFRGLTVRETCLVHGPAGWAEFAPFVEYAAPEAAHWLAAAVESAVLGFPAPLRGAVPVNATIPAVPAERVPDLAARFEGATAVKVKIAEHGMASLEEDLARVAAVRRALPEAALRCDANAAYSPAEARTALAALAGSGPLQYVEQPVAAVEELAELRAWVAAEGLPVPLAADESIRKAEDPLRVAALGAADVIVVKVQPLGGIRAAARIVEEAGLPAVVSSALESSVGLAAGAALAASLPASALPAVPAAGLGTAALFAADVCDPPLLPAGGALPVGRAAPDEALLRAHAASPERVRFWTERLGACWDVLARQL